VTPGESFASVSHDVVIIGGGVIGCAIARELMHYRVRAALVEKECEVGFGISKANSGIIHGGHHASPATFKGRLEWAGNQMWDALCAELGFGFKRIGELTIASQEEHLATLQHLHQQGNDKGVPGLEIWERDRIRKEEPNLSDQVMAALYAPTTGVINPYEACFALIENACRNGLTLVTDCAVQALRRDEDSWAVQSSRGTLRGRFVINAAGLYADAIAELAGVRTFTIQPRKGEEYLLDRRLAGIVKRIIFPCPTPVSKGILVIPTYDGTIMVGPTAETVDDRQDLTTTVAGADAVFAAVMRVVPGISERDCIAEFAGLRAVADTEDFVIGPTSMPGFINVAGIQSPGLTAAPAIARMVCDILRDEGLPLLRNHAFTASVPRPVHVASLSTEAQIALAARSPRYGRIACRCEYVTDGEILDAIQRGARTLDGIKFRTRAGMGRCQGGFCTWRCMELLSRELGIAITDITKRGGGSWIVCARSYEAKP
jgi:glycerol-3-phosphate dehydrogenase